MIGYLNGSVIKIRDTHCVIETAGVGYKVCATRDTLQSLTLGSSKQLWIHTVVREDALDLYGFEHEDELRFFELLLTVPGIGPKSALSILDIAPVETLQTAIASGTATYLTTISGIGKKTA